MAIISARNQSFPRSIDVQVNVTRTLTELETDLSITVFVTQNAGFPHGAGRIRYYSSIQAVQDDFATTTEGYRAAAAFFAQSPRARTMAIAEAFTTAQSAFLTSGPVGAVAGLIALTDGSFTISIDGDEQDITGLDFSGDTDLDDVATTIQTALRTVNTGGFTAATAVIDGGVLTITSGTSGDASRVTTLSTHSAGTDISGAGFLNAQQGAGVVTDGYLSTGITQELGLIEAAARNSGRFIYGWALDRVYRDTEAQFEASLWAQSRVALMSIVSNSNAARDPQVGTDIGARISERGDDRTILLWSDVPSEYPDVATLSYALHVDYSAEDSTVTLKFKNLATITPANITESDLTVLEDKRYNVLTRVGNTARTFREGETALAPNFIDSRINFDNLSERMQVAVYNVFLRNKKVPFTTGGAALIEQAVEAVCQLFVLNATLAPRAVVDASRENGERIEPAYNIVFTPLRNISASARAGRIGPPFTVTVYEAGAIHSVSINVEVVT